MAGQAAELERLTAEVSEIETVGDSVVTLINQLAEIIRTQSSNPVELNALADRLDAKAAAISAAIVANTPAATEPPVP